MEFTGEVIEALPMSDRFTMSNMAIEAGAKVGLIAPDGITRAYVEPRAKRPFEFYPSDPEARYEAVYAWDVSSMEPMVALPHAPENVRAVTDLPEITIDQVVVGSCTNGRLEDLQQAAQDVGQHFLYANLTAAQSKQDVLDSIVASFLFPQTCSKNLDTLYDCMTDLVHKAGQQPGFVVVLEQLPDNPRFDREAREQLLDVFRDAADFWAERKIPFRCFYSFL